MRFSALLNLNDAVWQRLKKDAIKWAESDRPLPTAEESFEQVDGITRAVLPAYWNFPTDAHTFYADEFQSMVVMRREAIVQDMRRASL
jgi:hypothetical protein